MNNEAQPKAPKLPEVPAENVVKEEQAKGDVRPDGPGDDTAPVKPEQNEPKNER